jgi:predicted phage baseplate assembly protein
LAQVVHRGGYTWLYFAAPLASERTRSSVSVCANVAPATHGKTVAQEVLGSGDAGLANQRFVLKEGPLTYLPDVAGARSSLTVRVGGVLWQEVDSLLSQDGRSRCYVLTWSDSGQVSVLFGDGIHGARLPSGQDNVVASYRVGSGLDGELAAGSLQVLLSRPLGLRSLSQPLASSGAAAAASSAELVTELPQSVATLGRAVSLLDHETMAKSYPGISKAQATTVRSAGAVAVHLTVATDDGEPLERSSPLCEGLRKTLLTLGDPTQPLLLDDYQPRLFRLKLRLSVDPSYLPDSVCAAVKAALAQTFSFAARGFAQAVRAAEVLDAVQSVPGVQGALLLALHFQDEPPQRRLLLPAAPARIDRAGRSAGAEILILVLDDDSVGVLS